MLSTERFVQLLQEQGARLFCGVPDSLLASLGNHLYNTQDPEQHVIAVNEGAAIGLATGHFLATQQPAVVYMQNSGLGNAINPLTSIADPEVYGIPMMLVIGWRGEPGHSDEPQHIKQGKITPSQLEVLNIPYWVIDPDSSLDSLVPHAWACMTERSGPVALLVRAGTFDAVALQVKTSATPSTPPSLQREQAIEAVLGQLAEDAIVIATTGKTGRELFELRAKHAQPQRDFLTVGGMGHAASIALGVALAHPSRQVVCLDGDGAMLMHMGVCATIGQLRPANLVHVLLNNRAHESVGGLPTVAGALDFQAIAKACGYAAYHAIESLSKLKATFSELGAPRHGPVLCEIHLQPGARKDLGRPTKTPQQNKASFMNHVLHGSRP